MVLAGTIGPATVAAARAFTSLLTLDVPEGDSNSPRALIAVVRARVVEREGMLGDNRELVGDLKVVREQIWSPPLPGKGNNSA